MLPTADEGGAGTGTARPTLHRVDDPSAEPNPPPGAGRARALVDWCFRDRETGRIVVAQAPNLPLWIFLATVVARWVLPALGTARTVVGWIGLAALGWWALDETLRGVNPWRRALGVAGCALVLSGAVARSG